MDEHVYKVESLFSAAKSSFKHLKHFYFHNCLYEGVWKNNSEDGLNNLKLLKF